MLIFQFSRVGMNPVDSETSHSTNYHSDLAMLIPAKLMFCFCDLEITET